LVAAGATSRFNPVWWHYEKGESIREAKNRARCGSAAGNVEPAVRAAPAGFVPVDLDRTLNKAMTVEPHRGTQRRSTPSSWS
jgi:hypothetical protein